MIMNYHGNRAPKFFILLVLKRLAANDVDVIEKLEIYMYLVQFLNIFVESRS